MDLRRLAESTRRAGITSEEVSPRPKNRLVIPCNLSVKERPTGWLGVSATLRHSVPCIRVTRQWDRQAKLLGSNVSCHRLVT